MRFAFIACILCLTGCQSSPNQDIEIIQPDPSINGGFYERTGSAWFTPKNKFEYHLRNGLQLRMLGNFNLARTQLELAKSNLTDSDNSFMVNQLEQSLVETYFDLSLFDEISKTRTFFNSTRLKSDEITPMKYNIDQCYVLFQQSNIEDSKACFNKAGHINKTKDLLIKQVLHP